MADSAKKEKILIATGDATFGEQVASALKADGYANVHMVKSGDDALKSLVDLLPHLVILDISLAGTDGYQVLAHKMAEPLLGKIPVFLVSSQGVPINMRSVPPNSVSEFIMALHANAPDIVEKVDHKFGHEAGAGEAASSGRSANKMKLLWVEDDKLIGTILAKKLVAADFDLYHAKNGEEALEHLKTIMPNVIVVDLILPGMSGFEILQAVNKDERVKAVPKMVLSNLSKPSDIEKARALGAQKFLVKAATSLDQIVAEVKGMGR